MSPLPSRADRQTIEFRTAVMTRNANGQPRTLRVVRTPAQRAAYRRLAATILGLDVASLAISLRRGATSLAA
jgi:hypothetical protein